MTLPPVTLGDGLTVSAQGFGAMSLTDVYGPVTDRQALATLTAAVDAGVTFVDTANVYGDGRSESVVGRLLRTRRDEVQLATKVGIVRRPGSDGRAVRGDRAYIREQVHGSLTRLGTDRIDLYYQHRVDLTIPIEETVGALAELVAEGKVLHLGLSEATSEELRRACAVHPIAALQSEWSLISRDVEPLVVPAARECGVGFVSFSPLGRQWLTGRFDPGSLTAADMRHRFPRFRADALAANRPVLDELVSVARSCGLSAAQVALAWLHEQGRSLGVAVVPIPGSRAPEHMAENVAAVGVQLDGEAMARLAPLAGLVVGDRSAQPDWTSGQREPIGAVTPGGRSRGTRSGGRPSERRPA